ncbi:hypothetical protein B0H14DRAFT_3158126 [Mycena olivaceomarginata]|nr:hypothetical protein B0H14DRAFT_3158126 [Mycena olivaceomarginata]
MCHIGREEDQSSFARSFTTDYLSRQLKSALLAVQGPVSADAFQHCALVSEWDGFVILAEDRFNERLATISSVISWECQIAEWNEGGHHTSCRAYASLGLTELVHPTLNVRERKFLRPMLYHDYGMHASTICVKQARFVAEHPSCGLFVTLFDYSSGALCIEVHSAVDSPLSSILAQAGDEWAHFVARAEQSDRQLHLHVMPIAAGPAIRHFVVPLRTSSADMRDSVLALARDPQNEDIVEDIYDLLQEDSEVQGSH